jgi:hypothetical protein
MRIPMLAVVLLLRAAPAGAEAVSLDALTGAWVFETAPHQATGCIITGELTAVREGNELEIAMTARDTCPGGDAVNAIEQCRAAFDRDALRVSCVLVSAETDTYVADQFQLEAVTPTLMSGRLWDAGIWNAPVTWRRPASPMVS